MRVLFTVIKGKERKHADSLTSGRIGTILAELLWILWLRRFHSVARFLRISWDSLNDEASCVSVWLQWVTDVTDEASCVSVWLQWVTDAQAWMNTTRLCSVVMACCAPDTEVRRSCTLVQTAGACIKYKLVTSVVVANFSISLIITLSLKWQSISSLRTLMWK